MILKDYEVQFYIVILFHLSIRWLVNCWQKRYALSPDVIRKILHLKDLRTEYKRLMAEFLTMNVPIASKRIIGNLNVLGYKTKQNHNNNNFGHHHSNNFFNHNNTFTRPPQPHNGVSAPSLDSSLFESFQKFLNSQAPLAISASPSNGYGAGQNGYLCFDLVSQKLYMSRHVKFLELIQFSSIPASAHHMTKSDLIRINLFEFEDQSVPPTTTEQVPERVPELVHEPVQDHVPQPVPDPVPPFPHKLHPSLPLLRLLNQSLRLKVLHLHVFNLSVLNAITEELTSLIQNHTWDVVFLLYGKCVIGCPYVFKIKTKSDGYVERYKARLVAKGYSYEYGMDYEETFAHVAKMTTVRTLIAVASISQWKIFHMDVKNAFLNGDLHREVYMTTSPISHQSGEVCKLRKTLYGLKQAPHIWFEKFSTLVTSLGFVSSHHDSTLFFKFSSTGGILLSLYLDDMIITGDDCDGIESLKSELSRRFAMKDLELL